MIIDNFEVGNMHKLLTDFGEQRVRNIISNFSCPPNLDIENFLKKNAINFTRKSQSVTYLVFPLSELVPVAYFTLTIKPLTIGINDIKSNTQRKKIERICKLDEKTQSYTMAAYLIAQLGKNFYHGFNEKISGDDLLNVALKVLDDAKYRLGGTVAFVETEAEKKLIDFYNRNYFFLLEKRTDFKTNELVQLFRLL